MHLKPCEKKHREPNANMLIGEISKLFQDKMAKSSEKLGFKNGYRQILRHLVHEDGVTQIDLVRTTHLKAPTISVTLKKMEEEELVIRRADPMDLRVTRVYLSEKGRIHNNSVHKRLRELDAELMQGFSKEEAALLLQYLERMRDNILPRM